MWLSPVGILVLLLCINPTVSRETCSDGMIKDAILSLARIIRDGSQKAERHELRERQLGENLSKAVEALTKKVAIVDTFITHFSRIEVHISDIEQLNTQRNERERIQMQRTADLIESLEHRLQAQLNEINNTISKISQRVEPTKPTTTTESVSASDIISKLNDTEAHFLDKVILIESSLNAMATKNRENAATYVEKLKTALTERDEREKIKNQKTKTWIEDLERHLSTQLDEIKNTIHEVKEHVEPTKPTITAESILALDVISKLNDTEAHFLEKVAQIESSLDTMATKNEDKATIEAATLQTVFTEVKNISEKLGAIGSFLQEADEAAKREKEKPEEPIVDIAAIFEVQSRALGNVTNLVEDILNRMQELPLTSEVQTLHNETQGVVQESKYTLQSTISEKIGEIMGSVSENNKKIQSSIGSLRSDLATNAQHVNEKFHGLEKGQAVMVTTADEVLDTKKKVEYGVHQIVSEVSQLLRAHGEIFNNTVNERFDGISYDIINNHSQTLGNLKAEMDKELSQVWRQMKAIHQHITENNIAVAKLNQQNEAYVNDTFSTIDRMDTKVGDITKHVNEVANNLNYLLGNLSFVTDQFNQIKSGLSATLDNMKASFTKIQEKAEGLNQFRSQNLAYDYSGLTEEPNNSHARMQFSNQSITEIMDSEIQPN